MIDALKQVAARIAAPEVWYMLWWAGAWLVTVPPICVLLWLILQELRKS